MSVRSAWCLRSLRKSLEDRLFNWRWRFLLAAAGRDSPRRATDFLAARQESQQRNVPYIQRPRKLRFANLSGKPAVATNTGVRRNSLRAKALRSNSRRKSVDEVWLSCGSQTAGIGCDRRRWMKGWRNSQQPARVVPVEGQFGDLGFHRYPPLATFVHPRSYPAPTPFACAEERRAWAGSCTAECNCFVL